MTLFKPFAAALCAWMCMLSLANATTLQNDGTRMLDTSTNLLWLDLTETNGLSPDAAVAANPGFRIATHQEVLDLFATAGFSGVFEQRDVAYFPAANQLANFLGLTAFNEFSNDPRNAGQGWADDGAFYREPFYEVSFPAGQSPQGFFFAGNLFSKPNRPGINGVGTFLVKPVPLPMAAWFLMTALGGCFAIRRFGRAS